MARRAALVLIGIIVILSTCLPLPAQEKGDNRSLSGVTLEKVYVNKKMLGDGDRHLTFYRELLPGGRLYIAGKASAGAGRLARVEISTDGGKTWQQAKLNPKGTFRYGFRATAGATYPISIRATDFKGDVHDVQAGAFEVTIADRSLRNDIQETLDRLIEAYRSGNGAAFLSGVSDDYQADKTILDGRVRQDWSAFHDLDIRYSIINFVPDYRNLVSVSLNFNRRYTVVKTGKTVNDDGTATLIFRIEDDGLRLYGSRGKALFGLSR